MLMLTSQPACWEEEGEDSGWRGVQHRRKGGGGVCPDRWLLLFIFFIII